MRAHAIHSPPSQLSHPDAHENRPSTGITNHRHDAVSQRKLAALIRHSPRAVAQAKREANLFAGPGSQCLHPVSHGRDGEAKLRLKSTAGVRDLITERTANLARSHVAIQRMSIRGHHAPAVVSAVTMTKHVEANLATQRENAERASGSSTFARNAAVITHAVDNDGTNILTPLAQRTAPRINRDHTVAVDQYDKEVNLASGFSG